MKKLISIARAARLKAYAPYSKFRVGAALEAKDGRVFTGCNVENASYGVSCCAERVALYKAVSEGARSFKRIAIVAGTPEPCPPCGICRQALFEFSPAMELVRAGTRGAAVVVSLRDMLPRGFHKNGQ
ncbi:MAG: cytidine deaminase [Pseudomonadota bacterium]